MELRSVAPYAVVWGLSFGFALVVVSLARMVRSRAATVLWAAVIAGVVVGVEVATDRGEST